MPAQRTSSSLVCAGCIVPPAGRKIDGCKTNEETTTAETRGASAQGSGIEWPSISKVFPTNKVLVAVD